MGIGSSLFTGASGLQAHGEAIGILGDNIANSSTIGFKSSRANFDSVVGGNFPNGQRVGNGVTMTGSDSQFIQGSVLQTGRTFDFAIRGGGFFIVKGDFKGVPSNYFTRDGRFSLDKSGTLVNTGGLKVQGYLIDAAGLQATATSDLKIGGQSPPRATTAATMNVNLDSAAIVPAVWNPASPQTTSNFSSSITVYDSLGASHRADIFFRKQTAPAVPPPDSQWEYHVMIDGGEITGGTAGVPSQIANGTLGFDTQGRLYNVVAISSSANFRGATPAQAITFNFGDPLASGGTGLVGSTQFAAQSNVKAVSQDGYGSGALVDVIISENGTITGKFSNGQSRDVARVALATFGSEQGLKKVGSQLYSNSTESGDPLIAGASTGTRGALASGSLEASNVDLANELVTMIGYQRAFSANAKTVSTADDMLNEVANLKR